MMAEPASLRTAHPWAWDWTSAPAFDGGRDGPLLLALRARLASLPREARGDP